VLKNDSEYLQFYSNRKRRTLLVFVYKFEKAEISYFQKLSCFYLYLSKNDQIWKIFTVSTVVFNYLPCKQESQKNIFKYKAFHDKIAFSPK